MFTKLMFTSTVEIRMYRTIRIHRMPQIISYHRMLISLIFSRKALQRSSFAFVISSYTVIHVLGYNLRGTYISFTYTWSCSSMIPTHLYVATERDAREGQKIMTFYYFMTPEMGRIGINDPNLWKQCTRSIELQVWSLSEFAIPVCRQSIHGRWRLLQVQRVTEKSASSSDVREDHWRAVVSRVDSRVGQRGDAETGQTVRVEFGVHGVDKRPAVRERDAHTAQFQKFFPNYF